MIDLDAWFADPWNYQPPEEPMGESPLFSVPTCEEDHDHDHAWYCYSGLAVVAKPDNMRRDALDLIEAIRDLTEALRVKP